MGQLVDKSFHGYQKACNFIFEKAESKGNEE